MMTRVITVWCEHVTSLTTSVSIMRFLIEIMLILKAIKSILKVRMTSRLPLPPTGINTYLDILLNVDDLTLVVNSYEIYETRQRLVS